MTNSSIAEPQPHPTVPRAQIWATLVLGSMEARLPAPKQLRFGDALATPLVTLEFDTREQAQRWALWLRTGVVHPDMCMYAGTRLEWDWHLLWLERPVDPYALALAILSPDTERSVAQPEAALVLDDPPHEAVVRTWAEGEGPLAWLRPVDPAHERSVAS